MRDDYWQKFRRSGKPSVAPQQFFGGALDVRERRAMLASLDGVTVRIGALLNAALGLLIQDGWKLDDLSIVDQYVGRDQQRYTVRGNEVDIYEVTVKYDNGIFVVTGKMIANAKPN